MVENFYVDDLISFHNDSDQAVSVYQQLTTMLGLGGFKLHKWALNSPQVLDQIPLENQAISNVKSFDDSADSSIQTLGLLWHIDSDMSRFNIRIFSSSKINHSPKDLYYLPLLLFSIR